MEHIINLKCSSGNLKPSTLKLAMPFEKIPVLLSKVRA